MDSVGKKATAVNDILAPLGLTAAISAIAARAESHAECNRGAYSVVTARAVSSLPSLVELASPLLALGGRLVSLKGRVDDDELSRGRRAAGLCGMAEISVRRTKLPGGDEYRTIVTYERTGEPRLVLPRRDGLAQTKPLA